MYRSLCILALSVPFFSFIKTHKSLCNIHILPHTYYTLIDFGTHNPTIGTYVLKTEIKIFKEFISSVFR